MPRVLAFVEVLAAIESVGPSTIALSVLPTRDLTSHWATGEGSSGLTNNMKTRELLDATTLANVVVLRRMSMEEMLACMYH